MKRIQWLYNYLLKEPFIWIYWCFFQPIRFVQEIERKDRVQRITPMLRLILPLYLIILGVEFLLVLPTRSVLFPLNVLFSIALCIVWGIVENVATGIISGISLGLVLSLLWLIGPAASLGIEASFALGIVSCLAGDFAGADVRRFLGKIFVSAWSGFWRALAL